MEININNKPKLIELQDSITVQHLLDLEIPERQSGIAVAVNNMIVPRVDWSQHRILANDNILIIQATQGG
jgi:sulfur carrier protein